MSVFNPKSSSIEGRQSEATIALVNELRLLNDMFAVFVKDKCRDVDHLTKKYRG
jgi:hypothetical protein